MLSIDFKGINKKIGIAYRGHNGIDFKYKNKIYLQKKKKTSVLVALQSNFCLLLNKNNNFQ